VAQSCGEKNISTKNVKYNISVSISYPKFLYIYSVATVIKLFIHSYLTVHKV